MKSGQDKERHGRRNIEGQTEKGINRKAAGSKAGRRTRKMRTEQRGKWEAKIGKQIKEH